MQYGPLQAGITIAFSSLFPLADFLVALFFNKKTTDRQAIDVGPPIALNSLSRSIHDWLPLYIKGGIQQNRAARLSKKGIQ